MKFETDRFTANAHDGVAHVRFKGPAISEYSQALQLSGELRRAAAALEFHVLVLDLEGLDFLTSTLLEAFVSLYVRCRKDGREVRIVHAEPLVRDLLRTSQLDQIMPVFDRLDEALKGA